MIRIGLVVPVFPKPSETFIVNKFLGLLARGYDVNVITTQFDENAWSHFEQLADNPRLKHRIRKNSSFRSLARTSVAGTAYLLSSGLPKLWDGKYWYPGSTLFRSAVQLSKLAITLTAIPDILHFEFGSLAVQRAWIGKVLGCKVVVSFRGYDLNFVGLDNPNYYSQVWKHVDGIHCLGEDLWRRAQQRGCPASIARALISPAIEVKSFQRTSITKSECVGSLDRPLRVLSVGRLEWKKGYEYALTAVKILRDRGLRVHYRIVGSGEYLEAVAFCRHQLGLEDCVELVGAATQAQVRAELEVADVLLHSAVSEGFCNAVIEAQAMEVPVVTTDADGLSENVADGVTGWVVRRRDTVAMADALVRLAYDGKLRSTMGAAGKERVIERFRLEQQIDAFDEFYQRVLAAGSPTSSRVQ